MRNYPEPVAFCFTEPCENTGGIIFARSNIEARKTGALEWNGGELAGCRCYRAPLLDKYAGGPVSGVDMILHYNWWLRCIGCQQRVDLEVIESDRLQPLDAGDQAIWCSKKCRHETRMQGFREQRLKKIVINTMVEALKRVLPGAEPLLDKSGVNRPHVFIGRHDRVEQAALAFAFPGMKYGPGHYRIDVKAPEPRIMVCAGDIETFKAWRETQREPQR